MCSNEEFLKSVKQCYPKLSFKEDPTTSDVIVNGYCRLKHEWICDKLYRRIIDILNSEFRMRPKGHY